MSVRRFKVVAHLDGAKSVTIEITPTAGGTDAVVMVRPKGKRIQYTGMLSDVALIVASRHAKAVVQADGIAVPRARKRSRSL